MPVPGLKGLRLSCSSYLHWAPLKTVHPTFPFQYQAGRTSWFSTCPDKKSGRMQDDRLDSTFAGAVSVKTARHAAGCIGKAEPYVVVLPMYIGIWVVVITVGHPVPIAIGIVVVVPRTAPQHPVPAVSFSWRGLNDGHALAFCLIFSP